MTTSSGQQTQQQSSQTQPWQPAVPALTSILSNIQGLQGNSGINTTENSAIQQLTQNASNIPNFGPQAGQQAGNFIGGDPFNIVNPAYQGYGNLLSGSGITNPANLNPLNTPGLSNALNYTQQQVANNINGEFAGAGRDLSPANTQALAYGETGALDPIITGQYNQNVQNLMNAGNNLFTAGIGTNQALGGNVIGGAGLAGLVPGLATQGPGTLLNAGQTPFNLLTGNQGTLAGLTVPIAGLGGQSQGQSQTNTSNTLSPLQALVGAGSLFGGQYSPISGGSKFLGGLFGGA